MMPSYMKQEVNNGLIKAEETTEALIKTREIYSEGLHIHSSSPFTLFGVFV